MNTETLKDRSMKRKGEDLLVLADSGGVSRRFWFVQGDAAAGVDKGDKGRRRPSSCGLGRHEEEEEGEKEKGENERRARGLIYRAGRTNGRRENRGGRKMDKRRRRRLDF